MNFLSSFYARQSIAKLNFLALRALGDEPQIHWILKKKKLHWVFI